MHLNSFLLLISSCCITEATFYDLHGCKIANVSFSNFPSDQFNLVLVSNFMLDNVHRISVTHGAAGINFLKA